MQPMLAYNLYMIFQYAYAAQGIDYKWMNKVIRFFYFNDFRLPR